MRFITLRILAIFLMILGGIGWFGGTFDFPWAGSSYERPLGNLQGISVDSSGNIYCGVRHYKRVQKYDPSGNFIYSLRVHSAGGVFRLRVNSNDELEVTTARTDCFYRYSSTGELLERKDNVRFSFNEYDYKEGNQCMGPASSTYRIRSSFLFPSIEKTSLAGKSTVVSMSISKWLIMGPFPAWFFLILGLIMHGVLDRLKKKRRRNLDNSN